MSSSGMLRRLALVRTDASEELSASIIKEARIGELGTTLALISNRRTLKSYILFIQHIKSSFRFLTVISSPLKFHYYFVQIWTRTYKAFNNILKTSDDGGQRSECLSFWHFSIVFLLSATEHSVLWTESVDHLRWRMRNIYPLATSDWN
jgi:hypothetical protein